TVSENGRFVAAPVAILVFEDENPVVRHLAGFNLRIHRAADDPQPPARVEAHLDRFQYPIHLGGEEIDLKTVGHLEGSQFGRRIIRVCGERARAKHQTPNTNHQTPKKLQVPSSKAASERQVLEFKAWDFSGAWCLGFGVSFKGEGTRLAV